MPDKYSVSILCYYVTESFAHHVCAETQFRHIKTCCISSSFNQQTISRRVPPYEPRFHPDKKSFSSNCCLVGGQTMDICKEPMDNDCKKWYIDKVLFCTPHIFCWIRWVLIFCWVPFCDFVVLSLLRVDVTCYLLSLAFVVLT